MIKYKEDKVTTKNKNFTKSIVLETGYWIPAIKVACFITQQCMQSGVNTYEMEKPEEVTVDMLFVVHEGIYLCSSIYIYYDENDCF